MRHASRTYGVSPSTVFQAYYLLEDRGLIQARARSGYFVREHAKRPLHEPDISTRPAETTEVGVSELVFRARLAARSGHRTLRFGLSQPRTVSLQRLARSMAQSVRDMPAREVIAEMTAGNLTCAGRSPCATWSAA